MYIMNQTIEKTAKISTVCQFDVFIQIQNEKRPEFEIWRYIAHLSDGLAYLHKEGIAHHDFKPKNIVVKTCDDKHVIVKIIDFGLSIRFETIPLENTTHRRFNKNEVSTCQKGKFETNSDFV